MNEISIEPERADDVAPPRLPAGDDSATAPAQGIGMEALSAGDYCHLAEECFFLAAVAKDPEAAAKLAKAGDDYLRCAAGWLADQLRT
jgi:hypothetical protein